MDGATEHQKRQSELIDNAHEVSRRSNAFFDGVCVCVSRQCDGETASLWF